MSQNSPVHIAYFVTPHGFGHAARAAAIMEAMAGIYPNLFFEIFTMVPEWFFSESLSVPFRYHPIMTDIGLVQNSPMQEDISTTLQRLEAFLPFNPTQLNNLSRLLNELQCRMVCCDIAPLGIAVAEKANLPSILIENFTWDWIYQEYLPCEPRFKQPVDYLQEIFSRASYHIQTTPVCNYSPKSNLVTHPISRSPRKTREQIRQALDLQEHVHVILLTMGGIDSQLKNFQYLNNQTDAQIIIPGADQSFKRMRNLVLLPHHSQFFHPDLLSASDAVIGKSGYSTVSETYQAGIPYAYISRRTFRESPVLAQFIKAQIPGFEIPEIEFSSGEWVKYIPGLLAYKPVQRSTPNGAIQAAEFILQQLNR